MTEPLTGVDASGKQLTTHALARTRVYAHTRATHTHTHTPVADSIPLPCVLRPDLRTHTHLYDASM